MAKYAPTGDRVRRGAVRYRTQIFNLQSDTLAKLVSGTGRFIDRNKDGDRFKVVRKEPRK